MEASIASALVAASAGSLGTLRILKQNKLAMGIADIVTKRLSLPGAPAKGNGGVGDNDETRSQDTAATHSRAEYRARVVEWCEKGSEHRRLVLLLDVPLLEDEALSFDLSFSAEMDAAATAAAAVAAASASANNNITASSSSAALAVTGAAAAGRNDYNSPVLRPSRNSGHISSAVEKWENALRHWFVNSLLRAVLPPAERQCACISFEQDAVVGARDGVQHKALIYDSLYVCELCGEQTYRRRRHPSQLTHAQL